MSALEPDPGEADVDEIVETIADAGPDDARTVIPTAQAEALIRRDVHGQSRPETAAAIDGDLTVYAVDDRLRRARDNSVAAVATVRRLLEADAIDEDADDDLAAIRRLLTSHEDAVSAAETEDVDEPGHAGLGADAAAWGRLMALEATHEVTRGNGAVSLTLDDADDHSLETVREVLDGLGLEVVDRTEYGTGGRETIRATHDTGGLEDVDEEAESDRESEAVSEADPEPDAAADRRNVLLLGSEPIPDRTDRLSDDDLDELAATVERTLAVDLDDLENGEILGSITLEGDTWSFKPDEELVDDAQDEELADVAHAWEDEDADEDDGYSCEDCGDTFDTPGGLGGHRKYCPDRPESAG
jgi:hypothetical protein